MKRIIFIEGAPAVGKTTYAKSLQSNLIADGKNVVRVQEHSVQSIDMSRQAHLKKEEYQSLLLACDDYFDKNTASLIVKQIREQSRQVGGNIVLAYMQLLTIPNKDLQLDLLELRDKEIVDGRVRFVQYRRIVQDLWKAFIQIAKQDNNIYIIEGSLIQNQLYDLIGYYMLSDQEILSYCQMLLSLVSTLSSEIIYIDTPHLKLIIEMASKERGSIQDHNNGEEIIISTSWYEAFQLWVESSPYGKAKHLAGFNGVYAFCAECQRVSRYVLNDLDIPIQLEVRML